MRRYLAGGAPLVGASGRLLARSSAARPLSKQAAAARLYSRRNFTAAATTGYTGGGPHLSTAPTTPAAVPPQRKENRLAAEKSPYLLQHKHNPVDWYCTTSPCF
jgi:uncharacterized protein (DUF2126 family)